MVYIAYLRDTHHTRNTGVYKERTEQFKDMENEI